MNGHRGHRATLVAARTAGPKACRHRAGARRGLSALLTRFADALAIDASGWDRHAPANESLDATPVELRRRLNRVTAPVLDRRAQRRLINAGLMPTTGTGRRLRCRPSIASGSKTSPAGGVRRSATAVRSSTEH